MAIKIALTDAMTKCPRVYYQMLAVGRLEGADIILPDGSDLASQCSAPTQEMPPLVTQIKNAGKAFVRVMGAVVKGQPVRVPAQVLAEREAICSACEENLNGRCSKCGCGVRGQLIRKTPLATESCPLTPPKWAPWTGEV